MSSKAGSTAQSARAVRRAAVVTHGRPERIGPALERLQFVAREAGVELLFAEGEAEKHGLEDGTDDLSDADIAVVLGGDGTMLRALQRFLGTGTPTIGVNFGRVGFLTSIQRHDLDGAIKRVFAGDYNVFELPTLELHIGDERWNAINDGVATSPV